MTNLYKQGDEQVPLALLVNLVYGNEIVKRGPNKWESTTEIDNFCMTVWDACDEGSHLYGAARFPTWELVLAALRKRDDSLGKALRVIENVMDKNKGKPPHMGFLAFTLGSNSVPVSPLDAATSHKVAESWGAVYERKTTGTPTRHAARIAIPG